MSANFLSVDQARTRRKSSTSVMSGRKLSHDVTRKLSAISTAQDVSEISDKLGLEQGTLGQAQALTSGRQRSLLVSEGLLIAAAGE